MSQAKDIPTVTDERTPATQPAPLPPHVWAVFDDGREVQLY